MATTQGSTLYGGSVSSDIIYQITQGEGLKWANHLKTEINVDAKPRQLTRAIHAGNPLIANIKNPRDADFVGAAGTTIDGRELSVVPLIALDTYDVAEWKETFPRFQPKGLNVDLQANPEILKVVLDLMMDAIKNQINNLYSQGDTDDLDDAINLLDGFYKLIISDADATVVGTPVVLTSSNILARFYALRNAVDPRLRTNPSLKIFCSWEDFDLWDVARRTTQTQLAETDLVGSDILQQSNGSRMNIVPIEGLPKDFAFATIADKSAKSNLVQGLWLGDDLETIKVYKSEPADQEYKMVARMDIGVNYKSGKDIWYINNGTQSI